MGGGGIPNPNPAIGRGGIKGGLTPGQTTVAWAPRDHAEGGSAPCVPLAPVSDSGQTAGG